MDPTRRLTLLEGRANANLQAASKWKGNNSVVLNEVQKLTDLVEELEFEIFQALSDEQIPEMQIRFATIREKLVATIAEGSTVATSNSPSTSSVSDGQDILPLPILKLPTFSGNVTEWPKFSQRFQDSIARHPNLTPMQKLDYLNSCLTGEAQRLIAFYTNQPNAYEDAWKRLIFKYERKLDIVQSLLDQFWKLKPCTQPSDLEKLADNCIDTRQGLTLMGLTTEGQDHIWTYMLQNKLDPVSKSAWLVKQDNNKLPNIEEFLDFLYKQSKSINSNSVPLSKPFAPMRDHLRSRKCVECTYEHPFYLCPIYKKANVDERWNLVKKHKLCHNCLRVGHTNIQCMSSRCQNCDKHHHTSLHQLQAASSTVACAVTKPMTTVLATLLLYVENSRGRMIKLRAMLDNGAQISLMSKHAYDKLQIPSCPPSMTFVNANGSESQPTKQVSLHLENSKRSVKVPASVHVVENLCEIPYGAIDTRHLLKHLENRTLADPDFQAPGPIDLILGLDVHDKIVSGKMEKIDSMFALETIYGWVLYGSLPFHRVSDQAIVARATLYDTLKTFWEVEDLPKKTFYTKEEQEVEDFTLANTTRLSSGRFQMKIPLLCDPPELGSTNNVAVSRLYSLERKFSKDPEFELLYRQAMQEYIKDGHLERAPRQPENPLRVCYLPHQGVLKSDKPDKIRVVFDASARSSNGKSLNDNQPSGPKLQRNIFDILLRFRSYPVAITADIQKMYLQIRVSEEDRDLQRVLWRADTSSPIEEYRLTSVTFGERIAPYMAIKSLHLLSSELKDEKLSKIIREDFYVDDLLSGAHSLSEAVKIKNEIRDALSRAGFQTHKWTSNCKEISENSESDHSDTINISENGDSSTKTLGIIWNSTSDNFRLQINESQFRQWTRRNVLSLTNGIYDPLGWLSPATLIPKKFVQSLCRSSPSWDKPIPASQCKEWSGWVSNMSALEPIQIKRYVWQNEDSRLCCFCDASEKAYAAVIYSVLYETSGTEVQLLAAKTRVAPLQTVSLPRLELLGALLLSRLARSCQEILKVPLEKVHLYTDSTVALSWISGHPSRWSTFVANRVSEIQNSFPIDRWQHVKGDENPADLATRGLQPEDLSTATLWWSGPSWLSNGTDSLSHPTFGPFGNRRKEDEIVRPGCYKKQHH